MDPIHPIVPQAPVIPGVSPSAGVTRVGDQGQQRQREAAARERRRRAQQAESEAQHAYDEALDDEDIADDDDGRPHIDLTA